MSAAGKMMARDLADKMPPPDRLRSGGGMGGEDDGEETDEGATMGSALADALKSGDGAAIYSAFKDLADHCGGGE